VLDSHVVDIESHRLSGAVDAHNPRLNRALYPDAQLERSPPSIMAGTEKPSKAYWGLCTYSALTITVSNARADSARGTGLWGWNRISGNAVQIKGRRPHEFIPQIRCAPLILYLTYALAYADLCRVGPIVLESSSSRPVGAVMGP
jgi:hypothetical protein